MVKLVLKSNGAPVETVELKPGLNRLGRSATSDFPIDHPTVSAAHCEILVGEDSVTVRDCGSTNGTFIDDRRITEEPIYPGQRLKLGEVERTLERGPLEKKEIQIAIPRVEVEQLRSAPLLPDGSSPCLNHPAARAAYKCPQCQHYFCEACLHHLRRVGGEVLQLCPLCSGRCESIAPKAAKRAKHSLFHTLQKTLKMVSKKKKQD